LGDWNVSRIIKFQVLLSGITANLTFPDFQGEGVVIVSVAARRNIHKLLPTVLKSELCLLVREDDPLNVG
jgi:hypothetical protein